MVLMSSDILRSVWDIAACVWVIVASEDAICASASAILSWLARTALVMPPVERGALGAHGVVDLLVDGNGGCVEVLGSGGLIGRTGSSVN